MSKNAAISPGSKKRKLARLRRLLEDEDDDTGEGDNQHSSSSSSDEFEVVPDEPPSSSSSSSSRSQKVPVPKKSSLDGEDDGEDDFVVDDQSTPPNGEVPMSSPTKRRGRSSGVAHALSPWKNRRGRGRAAGGGRFASTAPRPSSRLLQSSITMLIHPKLDVPRHPSTLDKSSSSSSHSSPSNAVQSKLPDDLRSSVLSRKPVKKQRKKRSYPKFYVQTTLDALSQAAKRKPAARKQYLLPKPSEVLDISTPDGEGLSRTSTNGENNASTANQVDTHSSSTRTKADSTKRRLSAMSVDDSSDDSDDDDFVHRSTKRRKMSQSTKGEAQSGAVDLTLDDREGKVVTELRDRADISGDEDGESSSSSDDEAPLLATKNCHWQPRQRPKSLDYRKKNKFSYQHDRSDDDMEDDDDLGDFIVPDSEDDEDDDQNESSTSSSTSRRRKSPRKSIADELQDSQIFRGTSKAKSFPIWLQYLTSALLDPSFEDAVANDAYFRQARQYVEDELVFRRDSLVRSNVWDAQFTRILSHFPRITFYQSKVSGIQCTACRRSNTTASHAIEFSGERYSSQMLWEGTIGDVKIEHNAPLTKRLGRTCFNRVRAFHALNHFKLAMILRLKARIETVKEKHLKKTGEDLEPSAIVEKVLTKAFEKEMLETYQEVLDIADRYCTKDSRFVSDVTMSTLISHDLVELMGDVFEKKTKFSHDPLAFGPSQSPPRRSRRLRKKLIAEEESEAAETAQIEESKSMEPSSEGAATDEAEEGRLPASSSVNEKKSMGASPNGSASSVSSSAQKFSLLAAITRCLRKNDEPSDSSDAGRPTSSPCQAAHSSPLSGTSSSSSSNNNTSSSSSNNNSTTSSSSSSRNNNISSSNSSSSSSSCNASKAETRRNDDGERQMPTSTPRKGQNDGGSNSMDVKSRPSNTGPEEATSTDLNVVEEATSTGASAVEEVTTSDDAAEDSAAVDDAAEEASSSRSRSDAPPMTKRGAVDEAPPGGLGAPVEPGAPSESFELPSRKALLAHLASILSVDDVVDIVSSGFSSDQKDELVARLHQE